MAAVGYFLMRASTRVWPRNPSPVLRLHVARQQDTRHADAVLHLPPITRYDSILNPVDWFGREREPFAFLQGSHVSFHRVPVRGTACDIDDLVYGSWYRNPSSCMT